MYEHAFRDRVKRRILSNTTSAGTLHEDFSAAQAAEGRGAEDLLRSKPGKNSKRDLLKKVLKDNEWPGLYWAEIPMKDLKTGGIKKVWMPFLLPHEWAPQYCTQPGALADLHRFEDAKLLCLYC